MDLNKATKKQAQQIPSIGSTLAKRLISSRPFKSWSEVDAVRGVGPKRLEALKTWTFLGEDNGPKPNNDADADGKTTAEVECEPPVLAIAIINEWAKIEFATNS